MSGESGVGSLSAKMSNIDQHAATQDGLIALMLQQQKLKYRLVLLEAKTEIQV